MEGYMNISGNHEDFDDLDIEGRITLDEWNCEDDDNTKEKAANDREEKRLLSIKVKLDDGGFGYVFSVKTASDHTVRWNCHLCDVLIIGQRHVETHIQSKKHQIKMALPSHPANLFKRIDNKPLVEMPTLAPGEPVPPGFEDVVKRITQIQATLDSHKSSPLIGLEYLVELTPDETGKEPTYVCMLCDKKGDPRVAMAHITSLSHRQKYIGIHFPTANKAMFNDLPRSKEGRRASTEIVNRICAKIEEKYGRLQPMVVEKELFETKKDQIMRQIQVDRHFRETPEETFVELVDISVLDTIAAEDADSVKGENKSEIDSKSTFIKGKICDRSRLRIRGLEDTEDDIKFGKLEHERKKPGSGIKKMKVNSADSSRKSLSSISSLSTSSRSRSPSRSRSKSFSRSRSRSYSRSRYNRYAWREAKYGRNRWRRSRSGSRGWRRSRSRSRRSRSFSPGSRYLRRESPDSPGRRHRYHRSRSPKYNRYRDSQNDRFNKHRDKSDREKSDSVDPRVLERSKWTKFRQEVDKIERELAKQLKFHEKNPEKHPMYPEEWKKFWNRRYKELQTSGEDPSKHDFKPEWIEFWNKRMKEMHEEALKSKKEETRLKLGLPKEEELIPFRVNRKNRPVQDSDIIIISPPPNNEEEVIKKDVTVTDIKNTWKALTGSDIKDTPKRSPSPWEEGEAVGKHIKSLSPSRRSVRGGANIRGKNRGGRVFSRKSDEFVASGIVEVLRHMTALESQLGSLGPRVNMLLASALSLEKSSLNSSYQLLANSDNFVLLETVKEKLKGQLLAGIVKRNMVMATKTGIEHLSDVLAKAEDSGVTSSGKKLTEPLKPSTSVPVTTVSAAPEVPVAKVAPAAEPVTVPGIGTMDKVAIAQQIASALVAQGKTDVTQEELEQLINAVVGMAQASTGSEKVISTASYVSQMQQHLSCNTLSDKLKKARSEETTLQKLTPLGINTASVPGSQKNISKTDPKTSALALLQSAYDEPKISPGGTIISNKVPINQKDGIKDSVSLLKQQLPSPSTNTVPGQHLSKSDMDDLTEEDLQTLLQNFNDLSSEEQQGLITYLKKMETKEPQRVEKLRQYVTMSNEENTSQQSSQNLKSSLKSSRMSSDKLGRLSPFSLRQGGINPSQESEQTRKELSNKEVEEDQKKSMKLEDSDDDYSFEDIYKAASQNVKEREKAKLEEEKAKQMLEIGRGKDDKSSILKKKTDDPYLILKETKEMIANLMGQLPSKFIQKQAGSPGSRKDSPSVLGNQSNVSGPIQRTETKQSMEMSGQRIQALGSDIAQIQRSGQTVPTLETSRQMYQNYPNSNTYANQYSSQNYPGGQQSYSAVQQSGYSGGYQQNNGYYGNIQQQYSQNPSGNYSGSYSNHGTSGGWSQYPDQYGQQHYQQPAPGPYSQYPNQPSNFY